MNTNIDAINDKKAMIADMRSKIRDMEKELSEICSLKLPDMFYGISVKIISLYFYDGMIRINIHIDDEYLKRVLNNVSYAKINLCGLQFEYASFTPLVLKFDSSNQILKFIEDAGWKISNMDEFRGNLEQQYKECISRSDIIFKLHLGL